MKLNLTFQEGLTAEETAKKEPDESERMQVTFFFTTNSNLFFCLHYALICIISVACMQMTDARCSRCSEFKVGVRDIIQAGHGERYQVNSLF